MEGSVKAKALQFQRFTRLNRGLHALMIISFISLALTGMTLKFSYLGWAQWLSRAMGGFQSAGFIHRICALITFFPTLISTIVGIRGVDRELYDLMHSLRASRWQWAAPRCSSRSRRSS